MYRRTKDITPYWLFVKDISAYLHINTNYANSIASFIWPTSIQKEKEEYKVEAKIRKQRLKEVGPIIITQSNLLNESTRAELDQFG